VRAAGDAPVMGQLRNGIPVEVSSKKLVWPAIVVVIFPSGVNIMFTDVNQGAGRFSTRLSAAFVV
jgi:hypothetical protein